MLIVKGFPGHQLHSLPAPGSDLAPLVLQAPGRAREAARMLIVFVRAAGLRALWLSLLAECLLQRSLGQGFARKPTGKQRFPGLFLLWSSSCGCGRAPVCAMAACRRRTVFVEA